MALRILAERETDTEAFVPDEWWTVDVVLVDATGKPFKVVLFASSAMCFLPI